MQLFFPSQSEIRVTVEDGYIYIEESFPDGESQIVRLSEHQFMEIWNREKALLEACRSGDE